ncbi:unnamed protein product, partial [Ascophyllum nodosum]
LLLPAGARTRSILCLVRWMKSLRETEVEKMLTHENEYRRSLLDVAASSGNKDCFEAV